MGIVAGHAAAQAGNMASKGAYSSARVCMRAWSNLMQRNASTPATLAQVHKVEMRRGARARVRKRVATTGLTR